MKRLYGLTLGLVMGAVVWLSTGSTGLGLVVAAVLAVFFIALGSRWAPHSGECYPY